MVLNLEQLHDITLEDPELMREILAALIEDTSQQLLLLESAIRERDGQKTARLAHYSKGACANVGAEGAATLLKQIEKNALKGEFQQCSLSVAHLAAEVDLLRGEAAAL